MPTDDPYLDRRRLLKLGTATAAGLILAPRAADAQRLPPPPAPMPPEQRVSFAVVALGRLSLEHILPAFAESKKAKSWREKKALAGGGSLFDIGLYIINTSRFLTGEEPVELWATRFSPSGDPRYAQVEETNAFVLRFPSNAIVNCFCSYNARDDKYQRLNFETAAVDMPNAYQYHGQRLTIIGRQDDATSHNELDLEPNNQFAAEIDHMATCVIENRKPRTPGEEGVQDHVIMEAVYESERSGRPVQLQRYDTLDTFRGPPVMEDA